MTVRFALVTAALAGCLGLGAPAFAVTVPLTLEIDAAAKTLRFTGTSTYTPNRYYTDAYLNFFNTNTNTSATQFLPVGLLSAATLKTTYGTNLWLRDDSFFMSVNFDFASFGYYSPNPITVDLSGTGTPFSYADATPTQQATFESLVGQSVSLKAGTGPALLVMAAATAVPTPAAAVAALPLLGLVALRRRRA